MPTLNPTPKEMESRIVRRATIKSMSHALETKYGIPPEVMEKIGASSIWIYMSPPSQTGSYDKVAGVNGPSGMQLTVCTCRPGEGPESHAHVRTVESFFVIKGKFEFHWGDTDQYSAVLGEGDFISVPANVMRRFTNVLKNEDSTLIATIQGADKDIGQDLEYEPKLGAALLKKYGQKVFDSVQEVGWRFQAEHSKQ
jgi:uncharacterized RmlC-like cupin family protein